VSKLSLFLFDIFFLLINLKALFSNSKFILISCFHRVLVYLKYPLVFSQVFPSKYCLTILQAFFFILSSIQLNFIFSPTISSARYLRDLNFFTWVVVTCRLIREQYSNNGTHMCSSNVQKRCHFHKKI